MLASINATPDLNDEHEAKLKEAIEDFKKTGTY
jgi:hypothetical protein